MNKILELQFLVKSIKPVFFVITESWMNISIASSNLGISDYRLFRKDRTTRGGGIFIAILNSIKATEIQLDSKCVVQAVDIFLSTHSRIRIINAYNPHANDKAYLIELLVIFSNIGKKFQTNYYKNL